MTDLIPFDYGNERIRVVMIDGEPWFVAADVCAVLGIGNVGNVLARLDDDEKGSIRLADGTPGNPNRGIVSEAGLYALVFQSAKPEARTFKRWITHDVIPSIRKTGGYGRPQVPGSYAEALELAAKQAREIEEASQRVRELEPAAHSWETLADEAGDYSLRQAAQILDRDPAIEMGQNRLGGYLREIAWIDRYRTPYQRQVDAGRMVQKACRKRNGDAGTQVRITPKGLHELHRRLGGQRPLRLDLRGEQTALIH